MNILMRTFDKYLQSHFILNVITQDAQFNYNLLTKLSEINKVYIKMTKLNNIFVIYIHNIKKK